ncbi:MAG TPA: nuclear transport factor 2 family protein [Solimonas sp.]|nr:nuclear transport factor 2 family protein [Solimonas sp.]
MHRNAELIEKFYRAFAALDAATMASCYAEDVEFQDEVFTLHGKRETVGMWSMLCSGVKEKGADVWRLEHSGIAADDKTGCAHWDAHYRFTMTGRMVLNRIDAEFEFRDGLIVRHRDRFDFWRWSRQALGAPGLLLGWTPLIRNKVQGTARANLQRFLAT